MYPLELIQSVRLITEVYIEIAPEENVLCITDRTMPLQDMYISASDGMIVSAGNRQQTPI